MNKIRIIGLLILLVGIIIEFNWDFKWVDFLCGLLIGLSIGMIITGRIGLKNLND